MSRYARVEPRFANGLGHDLPRIDEQLVAVRALVEELVIIRCEKTGELTLRMVMVSKHRRGPVEPGLQTPEARRGIGIAQHKCRASLMGGIQDISYRLF